uniref:Serine-threonine/tyrosine-protein kinase catalytic domain-containing protein n=1 Tax=Leersia perrieri TaxID=77586 RepID=A0A0D9XV25_9ORYZ
MAMWGGLGQAATVTQLVGADVGGLISMIMQSAVTARQNKKECEQLARHVFMIVELLPHLQDPEVMRRPEVLTLRPVMGGTLNSTFDVYSFGVVMLEVLTGKKPHFVQEKGDEEEETGREDSGFRYQSLVSFMLPLIEDGKLWKVLDKRPTMEPTRRQMEATELVAQTAARCLRLEAKDRPAISEVVGNLETSLELARCDG